MRQLIVAHASHIADILGVALRDLTHFSQTTLRELLCKQGQTLPWSPWQVTTSTCRNDISQYNNKHCGYRIVVIRHLAMVKPRVRFPLSAQKFIINKKYMETTPVVPVQAQPVYKLSGFFKTLSAAWTRYKTSFTAFTLITITPVISIIVIALLMAGLTRGFAAAGGVAIVISFILFIVQLIIQSLAQLATVVIASNPQTTVKGAFNQAAKIITSYWWLVFLMSLVFMGGFIALVIPGIILAVSFSISIFVLVNESNRGLAALTAARNYVKGYTWPFFVRLFVFGVGTTILLSVGSAIFGEKSAAASIITGVLSLIITPLTSAFLYQLYSEIKNIKMAQPTAPIKPTMMRNFIIVGVVGFAAILVAILALTTWGIKSVTNQLPVGSQTENTQLQEALQKALQEAGQQIPQ